MFSGKTTQLLRRVENAANALTCKHAADSRYSHTQIVSHAGKCCPAIGIREPHELLDHVRDGTRLVALDEAHFFDVAPTSPRECVSGVPAGEGGSAVPPGLEGSRRSQPGVENAGLFSIVPPARSALETCALDGEGYREAVGASASPLHKGGYGGVSLCDVVSILAARGIDVIVAALQPDSWGRPFPVVTSLLERADHPILTTATCARCGRRAERTQRLTPIVNGQMVVGPENYEPRCCNCWRPPPTFPLSPRERGEG